MSTASATKPRPAVIELFDHWMSVGAQVSLRLIQVYHHWNRAGRMDDIDASLHILSSYDDTDYLSWDAQGVGAYFSSLPTRMREWRSESLQGSEEFPKWLLCNCIVQLVTSAEYTGSRINALCDVPRPSAEAWRLVQEEFVELAQSRLQFQL